MKAEKKMTEKKIGIDAKGIFLAWEKRRPVYVIVLAVAVLALAFLLERGLFYDLRFWIYVVEGAVVANVAYFAGPILECYLSWLDRCPSWYRNVAYWCGLVFTFLMAMIVLGYVQFVMIATS